MHSQNLEEKFILEYFSDFVGTFVDIGANDGTTFSNTRALAMKGWRGILIEPSPKAFEKLKTLYNGHKGFYVYPYAIGTFNGKGMLQESGPLCSPQDVGLVSTFHAHEQDRFKKTVKYEPVEVKVYTWRTALNRWKIRQFDFLSLDAEGADLDILKQIDLSKTKCVCCEWNGNIGLREEFCEIMKEFPNIIYTSGENLIFAR